MDNDSTAPGPGYEPEEQERMTNMESTQASSSGSETSESDNEINNEDSSSGSEPESEDADRKASMDDIYCQVEYSTDPYEVLGIEKGSYRGEVRTAYKTLALLLHPDKCSPEDRPFHQKLFVKIHEAYQDAMVYFTDEDAEDEETTPVTPLTPEDRARAAKKLHARVWDARERLKQARETALAMAKKIKKGEVRFCRQLDPAICPNKNSGILRARRHLVPVADDTFTDPFAEYWPDGPFRKFEVDELVDAWRRQLMSGRATNVSVRAKLERDNNPSSMRGEIKQELLDDFEIEQKVDWLCYLEIRGTDDEIRGSGVSTRRRKEIEEEVYVKHYAARRFQEDSKKALGGGNLSLE